MNSTDMDFNIFNQCFNTSLNLVMFYICSAYNFMYIRYTYCTCIYVLYVCTVVSTHGGGGGTLIIYWWGVPQHIQEEGSIRHGHNQKKGVLGTDTTHKKES